MNDFVFIPNRAYSRNCFPLRVSVVAAAATSEWTQQIAVVNHFKNTIRCH